jgi:tetratricopeptide (TPR) repeat protein
VDSRGPTGSLGGEVEQPVRSGAVPPLADGFIVRQESAPTLEAALIPGAAVALVPGWVGAKESPDWLGSCGKTQLAVSFAESLWDSRGVDLLVWVVATSRASVLSGYVEAAVAAMGADPASDGESAAARFVGWLGQTSRPWLVVLDDLSDAADLDGLWPAGPAGRVLITTTNSATLPAGHQARVLPVGAFSSREALSYLMGRLDVDPDQRLGAIDLVKDLGCEPLALAQASAVIASSALSCRDYRGYFAQRREQMAEPAAAAVTWTFSVEQADRLWPGGGAQATLALAALLDGHGIPAAVFSTRAACGYLAGDGTAGPADQERTQDLALPERTQDLADPERAQSPADPERAQDPAQPERAQDPAQPERAESAVLASERAGLLSVDVAGRPPVVRMSPVVAAAVRAAMPDSMRNPAARAAADALLEVWPADDQQAWLAAGLRSCAASLQQAAGDLLWAGGCHRLLLRAGQSLDGARLTGPAIAYWRDLAAVSDRILGPGHPDTLAAGQRLADAYLTAGRAAEAVSWFQWVLADRARTLGPDHPATIAARRNLGHAAMAAGQFSEAISALDDSVGDYQRARGTDHLDTLGVREELAAAYYAAGQFADAIRLYRGTLADRERVQGPQHPATMTTRQKLAGAYLADGRLKDALSSYKRTLADRERVLGPDHMDTIAARGNLGSGYHAAGRMASALRLHEQACEGYERVLGADHPDTLARRANLAHAYYDVGRLTDATTLLRDTVARCERVLPPGAPLTQAVRESLKNIAGDDSPGGG